MRHNHRDGANRRFDEGEWCHKVARFGLISDPNPGLPLGHVKHFLLEQVAWNAWHRQNSEEGEWRSHGGGARDLWENLFDRPEDPIGYDKNDNESNYGLEEHPFQDRNEHNLLGPIGVLSRIRYGGMRRRRPDGGAK